MIDANTSDWIFRLDYRWENKWDLYPDPSLLTTVSLRAQSRGSLLSPDVKSM